MELRAQFDGNSETASPLSPSRQQMPPPKPPRRLLFKDQEESSCRIKPSDRAKGSSRPDLLDTDTAENGEKNENALGALKPVAYVRPTPLPKPRNHHSRQQSNPDDKDVTIPSTPQDEVIPKKTGAPKEQDDPTDDYDKKQQTESTAVIQQSEIKVISQRLNAIQQETDAWSPIQEKNTETSKVGVCLSNKNTYLKQHEDVINILVNGNRKFINSLVYFAAPIACLVGHADI